ncbi:MAG: prepilin-type N-terminal cleavage/methylation domain-containing protein [Thermoleophilia bacterium]
MNRFSTKKQSEHGFTLIELLIVIVIIGILAAIAIPLYLSQVSKAKDASVKEGVHSIEIGIQSCAVDNNGQYPTDFTDALYGPTGSVSSYLDTWPTNPYSSPTVAMANDLSGTSATSLPTSGGTPGDYDYLQTQSGVSFGLQGILGGTNNYFIVRSN